MLRGLRGLGLGDQDVRPRPGELPAGDPGLQDDGAVEAGALPVGDLPAAVDHLPLGGLVRVPADEERALGVGELRVGAGHLGLRFLFPVRKIIRRINFLLIKSFYHVLKTDTSFFSELFSRSLTPGPEGYSVPPGFALPLLVDAEVLAGDVEELVVGDLAGVPLPGEEVLFLDALLPLPEGHVHLLHLLELPGQRVQSALHDLPRDVIRLHVTSPFRVGRIILPRRVIDCILFFGLLPVPEPVDRVVPAAEPAVDHLVDVEELRRTERLHLALDHLPEVHVLRVPGDVTDHVSLVEVAPHLVDFPATPRVELRVVLPAGHQFLRLSLLKMM